MKRIHINLAVTDLGASVKFYCSLFSAQPTLLKPDYAKWILHDPRVNFAISTRTSSKGLDHLGIQVESDAELQAAYAVLKTAVRRLSNKGKRPAATRARRRVGPSIPMG